MTMSAISALFSPFFAQTPPDDEDHVDVLIKFGLSWSGVRRWKYVLRHRNLWGSCFMAHEAQDLSNEKSFFFRCQLSYFYVPLLHLQDDKAVLYASGHQWNDFPCQLSFLSSEEGNRHAAHQKIELDFPFKHREREKKKCLWIHFHWSADKLIHHFVFVDIKKMKKIKWKEKYNEVWNWVSAATSVTRPEVILNTFAVT